MTEQNINQLIQNLFSDFNNRNYQEVINNSLKLLDQNYKIPVIFNLIGTSYFLLKNYQKAIDYYIKGINIEPDNEEILRNIGKCYLSQKKYKDAQEYFNKSLAVKKNNPDALFNLGFIEILLDKPQQGIQLLKQALNLHPSFTECIYNLGLCYKNLGDYNTAIDYYLKEADNTSLFLDTIHMVETFRIELEYAYIDSRMPDDTAKEIVAIMKPYLRDFFIGLLCCNPLKKELSRSSALNGLRCFFQRFPRFGTLRYHNVDTPIVSSAGSIEDDEDDIEMSDIDEL